MMKGAFSKLKCIESDMTCQNTHFFFYPEFTARDSFLAIWTRYDVHQVFSLCCRPVAACLGLTSQHLVLPHLLLAALALVNRIQADYLAVNQPLLEQDLTSVRQRTQGLVSHVISLCTLRSVPFQTL